VTSIAGAERAERSHQLGYRPHLDGLRAVAVFLVVAFHADLGRVSGGFIGVDIFFVLSGFLVTRILVRDLASGGRVQWRRFYARRVRRILPAAVATLVLTAVVFAVVATPAEMLDALGGFRAAFFYVANWHFIHQSTDYFAPNVNTNPVLHFWSLAVEEQFYLLWPLCLGVLYVVTGYIGRRRWWAMRGIVFAAAIASAIEALHVGSTNLERAYYGTDTRAYQLLGGAVLALTPQLFQFGARLRRLAPWSASVALIGLLFLASSAIGMSAITRGIVVAVVASALIVALENARDGSAKRVLSSEPIVYLGRISYGIYLWHWPVIVVLTHDRYVDPVRLFLLASLIATALAALSFHFLEHPLRTSRMLDRYRTPVIVIGFTTSILIGLLVMPVVLDSGSSTVATSDASSSSASRLLDWRVAKKDIPALPDCLGTSVDRCTVVHGPGRRAVLMGDSVARMWIPTFTEIAEREGFSLSIASYPGCPWQRDLYYNGPERGATQCRKHKSDWYKRVVPRLHPDIVFLAQHGYDDPMSPNQFRLADGRVMGLGSDGFEQLIADASSSSLASLHAPGRVIVLIEPVPSPPTPFDPLSCLSKGGSPPSCGFRAEITSTGLEQYFRQAAAKDPSIKRIDLDRFVCPGRPRCDPIIRDIIVWRDTAHLTATYSRSLTDSVLAILRAQHIV
jgi:peptidoglycan/LPS O-acetylase OafA/YrhL